MSGMLVSLVATAGGIKLLSYLGAISVPVDALLFPSQLTGVDGHA